MLLPTFYDVRKYVDADMFRAIGEDIETLKKDGTSAAIHDLDSFPSGAEQIWQRQYRVTGIANLSSVRRRLLSHSMNGRVRANMRLFRRYDAGRRLMGGLPSGDHRGEPGTAPYAGRSAIPIIAGASSARELPARDPACSAVEKRALAARQESRSSRKDGNNLCSHGNQVMCPNDKFRNDLVLFPHAEQSSLLLFAPPSSHP